VVDQAADLGVAFDGDADRMVAVASDGTVVDGDHIIALCALDLRRRGRLADDTVVVTVMTNLGFRLAMAEAGIQVVSTGVGDRYVLEALDGGGYSLGGEQSGHIIFRDLATTGDGLLSAVQLLDLVVRAGRPLGDLAADAMTRLPQILVNVGVAQRIPDIADRLAVEIAEVETDLGREGRVLIRPSGTEPLIRVMVEAADQAAAEAAAHRLAATIESRFGT
jgi:phosphoglucosamine mutase